MSSESSKKPNRPISFTVDGEHYTVTEPKQTAASILRLVGMDPAEYELGEVKHNGETKTFKDDQTVHVNDGDHFVTVRTVNSVA